MRAVYESTLDLIPGYGVYGARSDSEIRPDGIGSVTPPDAVVSQRHRTDLVDNLRAEMCDHGHFFASASAASAWLAEYPDGRVLSVADAFEEYRAECEELGWIAPAVATSPWS